ncbi:hypothetical protein Kpol_460p22 [Vanderwaltozyma polyspora DSM 70294]|uniref:Clustered mitochondria protein homolog n=1 Tax=Vanderwaltozyma polyspora (strain ATCC 22028 / DSM 70294 / BCRC 21397 / CBS 2163 / NBRC 10782 / NRRL Y-8283 / UCD 57-17) TaxID=436907 RepID=CLU_VANPO|nr:uncharacterized protein Kpol_460p22 [Vanderwaltozyma polyspora DSM 70294]A7TQT8.1 RecName: Full=Clustered mitochondria protein homolog; AltName: Full=Protein TIF31 homolog [Vanderwaltozyma polyspora DSM 70294]EDO15387.1 hypothetical protein Kpol_460p22 [Vanderwaltozyma polyspora DSM 70294]
MSETGKNSTAELSAVKVTVKLPESIVHHRSHQKKQQSHNVKETNELSFQFPRETRVQTILDVLSYAQATKYLTNFKLKTVHQILNPEQSINEIINDEKSNHLNLSIELCPYNTREIVRHVLTLRDFIGFALETEDGISEFSISTGSKFSNIPFMDVKEKQEEIEEIPRDDNKNLPKKNVLKVSQEEKDNFSKEVHSILDSFKYSNSNLKSAYSTISNIVTPCLNSLNLSAFNPVPAFFKTKGHILYLHIVTLEGESFHVTAVPSGFYINKSSSNKFDPSMKDVEGITQQDSIKYNLYDLIALHSKKFHSHVEALEKKLAAYQSIEYVKPLTTFLHKPWLVSSLPANNADYSRMQLDSSQYESERNFNDEFQAIRELPTPTVQESIQSERLLSRISHEFTTAAVKGAMSIFYGEMLPLNPESDDQIFLRDNIFYSYVMDANGSYDGKGGNDAAFAASNQDLKTIQILKNLKMKDVYYLLTTIIDFGGKRILAQTPVPGLLSNMGADVITDADSGEQMIVDKKSEVSVVYGLDEESGKVLANDQFDKSVSEEFSKYLHLKSHDVEGSKISFSYQSKGILGSDKRNYIIDLANTYPLDVKFAKEHFDNAEESKRYPHRQTLLRPELVEKWWNSKVQAEGIEINKAYDEAKFTYNPDAYQVEGVEDVNIQDMSSYLVETVLPSVIEDYATGNVSVPYDGEHLVDTLHINGINVRYLGKLAILAKEKLQLQEEVHEKRLKEIEISNKDYEEWEASYLKKIEKMIIERQEKVNKLVQEGKEVPKELTEELKLNEDDIRKPTDDAPAVVNTDELLPLIKVTEIEIFARTMKHILRKYTKDLPVVAIPSMIAFVLNLLFGQKYNEVPKPESVDSFYDVDTYEFSKLTRDGLIKEIQLVSELRFRYELAADFVDQFSDAPFILIRSIARKSGIQFLNKDYFFTKDQFEEFKLSQDKKVRGKLVAPANTFTVSDLNMIPRIKDIDYSSVLSDQKWAEGSMLLNEDQNAALTLFAQAIAIKEEVNGVLHKDVAEKYLTLSTVYSKLGLTPEAVAFCRKSCAIYERVSGIDSFEMLRSLSNLALLEFANESPYNSALVFKRIVETLESLKITEKIHHPAALNAFNQLEQMSLGVENTKLTVELCKQFRSLIVSLDGNDTLAYATLESRIGNLYASINDFHNAMEHISKTPRIFTRELGTNHQITAQSRQWVNGLSNLMKDAQQKKKLAAEQASVNSGSRKKNVNQKADAPKAELAEKSVDELLDFIEGGSTEKSKKKSSKKKGKK